MDDKNNTLGLRIKFLRQQKKLSQTAFGDKIGLSQQTLVGIEKGRRETTVTRLVDIADFLDTTLDYLVGRTSMCVTDQMLCGLEDFLLQDFLASGSESKSDFFHYAIRCSHIADAKGSYLSHEKRLSYSIAERMEILFCCWLLQSASAIIDTIDKTPQHWHMVKNDDATPLYLTTLSWDLANYLQSDLDCAKAHIDSWLKAFNTLRDYGNSGMVYSEDEVEAEILRAKNKMLADLALRMEKMKQDAKKKMDAEAERIRKDMTTEKRKKPTRK